MKGPLVELENVARRYGPGPQGTEALRGVSFSLRAGERVAVVGPSGSGKSTLLHLMGLLDRPTAGRIRFAGRDTRALDESQTAALRAQAIGFVFQGFHLVGALTALDNVALAGRLAGLSTAAARARARALLERVGLGHRLEAYPETLSGGEAQRVAVARAVMNRPRLLLADEPTGALDRKNGERVLALLGELAASEGATLVLATHDERLAATMPRRLELLDGRLVADHRA